MSTSEESKKSLSDVVNVIESVTKTIIPIAESIAPILEAAIPTVNQFAEALPTFIASFEAVEELSPFVNSINKVINVADVIAQEERELFENTNLESINREFSNQKRELVGSDVKNLYVAHSFGTNSAPGTVRWQRFTSPPGDCGCKCNSFQSCIGDERPVEDCCGEIPDVRDCTCSCLNRLQEIPLFVDVPVEFAFTSITAALASLVVGDTANIFLSEGLYQENELLVKNTVWFIGAGKTRTIISGSNLYRVFHIQDPQNPQTILNVTYECLTIANGLINTASGQGTALVEGAGIFFNMDSGTLTLNCVDVRNNSIEITPIVSSITSYTLRGGGISCFGRNVNLIVNNSNVHDNSLTYTANDFNAFTELLGGGIFTNANQLSIISSRVNRNQITLTNNFTNLFSSTLRGGGIYKQPRFGGLFDAFSHIYRNTDISENTILFDNYQIATTVRIFGGGIYDYSSGLFQNQTNIIIDRCRISNNSARLNTIQEVNITREESIQGGGAFLNCNNISSVQANSNGVQIVCSYITGNQISTNKLSTFAAQSNNLYQGAGLFVTGGILGVERHIDIQRSTVSSNTITVTHSSEDTVPIGFVTFSGGGLFDNTSTNTLGRIPLYVEKSTFNENSINIVNNSSINNLNFFGSGISRGNNIKRSFQIVDSTISNNYGSLLNNGSILFASVSGGGIDEGETLNAPPSRLIINSTISSNRLEVTNAQSASFNSLNLLGGGIKFPSNGNPTGIDNIINSTIVYNQLILNGSIVSSTVQGGGFIHTSGLLNLFNSIVALNSGPASADGPDMYSPGASVTTLYSLLTNGGGNNVMNGIDNNVIDPTFTIGPLANNGGPTNTHALISPGSNAAINSGNNSLAAFPGGEPVLEFDQRGPCYPRILCRTVDMGSYEFCPKTKLVLGNIPAYQEVPEGTLIPCPDPNNIIIYNDCAGDAEVYCEEQWFPEKCYTTIKRTWTAANGCQTSDPYIELIRILHRRS
jgi:hypothetical protein